MTEEQQSCKKYRVLCLHGFRTSASFLHKQISKWDPVVLQKFDMCFLDGIFPAGGTSEIEGIFPPPYYEWFQFNKDFTEYTNLDECFSFLEDYMEKHGPFDGLLGFSQGATLAAALAGLQMKGILLRNHPPIRFVVSISGSKFRDPGLCGLVYSQPIKCRSVHMIGAKDWLRVPGEELLRAFESPMVIRHPQGHTVPRLDAEAVFLMNEFIDGLETEETRGPPHENGHISQIAHKKSAEDETEVEIQCENDAIRGICRNAEQGSHDENVQVGEKCVTEISTEV